MYPNYTFVDVKRIELPKGWVMIGVDLLHEFHDLKQEQILDDSFSVCGMREKFGKLDVQCYNAPLVVERLISGFSIQAERTCQDCGYFPAALHKKNNWVRVLCTNCAIKSNYKLV